MVHPVTPVGYEEEVIPLLGGGKKKRRIGARYFTYLCIHDRDKYNCRKCHGSRLCEVQPLVLTTQVKHHHRDSASRFTLEIAADLACRYRRHAQSSLL